MLLVPLTNYRTKQNYKPKGNLNPQFPMINTNFIFSNTFVDAEAVLGGKLEINGEDAI